MIWPLQSAVSTREIIAVWHAAAQKAVVVNVLQSISVELMADTFPVCFENSLPYPASRNCVPPGNSAFGVSMHGEGGIEGSVWQPLIQGGVET